MKILLTFALLLIVGCSSLKPRISLFKIFWGIHKEPYIVDVNDCSDKSFKYMKALKAAGYSSEKIVIRLTSGELQIKIQYCYTL